MTRGLSLLIIIGICGCSRPLVNNDSRPAVVCEAKASSSRTLNELGALPKIDGFALSDVQPSGPKLAAFTKMVDELNAEKNSILNEVFDPLLGGKTTRVLVVATEGVPEPYDAWTSVLANGSTVIVFNLSLWTPQDLAKDGLPVIRHEVAHVLVHQLVPPAKEESSKTKLEYLVFDEGIAHFIGYSGDRQTLLETHKRERQNAEASLAKAYVVLDDKNAPDSAKDELLRKADTGKYWEKFGSVAGMFRVAQVYQNEGPQGIRKALLAHDLSLR